MTQQQQPLIEAKGIDVRFNSREVLRKIDIRVGSKEIVTLIGPNGAGKTTLVRVILGLLKPNAGSIRRKKGIRIGYMPQRLALSQNLPLTVARFLDLAHNRGSTQMRDAVQELEIDHLLNNQMCTLSGGEMQRVLLARALLRDPDLLVLDEPVQGVDVIGQADLYALIGHIRDRHGCGVLMISHDLHLVMAATDHVVCLNRHVCCSGHPDSVSQHPAYLELFGTPKNAKLAIYTHHHNHTHDQQGNIVCKPEEESYG